ncbi:hypothetical protein LRS13_09520 [Svornostia abyssi]|uniref:Uncharacterized protein n=1 Tax=Svornostia abyssi TaxID=2898438 RepID=A0ABY5PM15_9ACTN|nr:hypothetical protein LRS13_09520 [Parviterribacteraceae bacterium J379]
MTATDSQIIAALGGVLSPTGKAAKITALLKSGYTFAFNAPGAGKLQVTWYYLPKGAKLAAKPKPVALAAGAATLSSAGKVRLTVKLNSAGKKKLRKARSLKLTARATFTAPGKKPLSTTRTFSVKR